MKKVRVGETDIDRLDPAVTSHYMLFQFMIGNLDWSALSGPEGDDCCHNTKLIGANGEAGPLFPLPYDFDSSGLVDAHYARAPESLGVKSIRDRLFRGFCDQNEFQHASRERFLSQREAIMALIQEEPALSKYSRKKAISYIEDFFDRIGDEADFDKEVARRCRG
jgi:hypothetical protein